MTLEKTTEKKFVDRMKNAEFANICLKLSPWGKRGYPDRMILIKGNAVFIEFKAPGKKPRPLQTKRMEDLWKLGFFSIVTDNADEAFQFVHDVWSGVL